MFACSSQPSMSRPPEPSVAATPRAPQPQLWGELKPIVSVKELMRDMLDPAADYVFDAVKIVYTRKGAVETTPKTEKDWDKIRIGAVTLVEGVYLLKIPRPFAPPGDENNSTGPDATELSPAQIKAKLEADPVLWNAKIEALRNVGLEVLEIVKDQEGRRALGRGPQPRSGLRELPSAVLVSRRQGAASEDRSRHPGTLRAVAACRAKPDEAADRHLSVERSVEWPAAADGDHRAAACGRGAAAWGAVAAPGS
jgi:hypothetical protein